MSWVHCRAIRMDDDHEEGSKLNRKQHLISLYVLNYKNLRKPRWLTHDMSSSYSFPSSLSSSSSSSCLIDTSCSVQASILHWRPSMRIRKLSFHLQDMAWSLLVQPGVLPPSTAACIPKWRSEFSRMLVYFCMFDRPQCHKIMNNKKKNHNNFYHCLLCADHPPSWLHVPVHPLFWGADHGALEACPA